MGRLRQVPKAQAPAEVQDIYRQFFGERDPVAEPGTATGTPGDYWTTFALVPELLLMARAQFTTLLQPGRKLDPKLRELAIVRTGIVGDCRFEYSQHLKAARMAGLPEEKLEHIKGWTTSDRFTPLERAVLAVTDEIILRNMVEDQTFAALQRHLSDPEIMELCFVIALWRMHGMIVRALHLEFDNDTTSRMTEAPMPQSESASAAPRPAPKK